MSYASGSEFLMRYDARLIGDLVRDDGTQENAGSLPNNLNLTTALSDAYGTIVGAIVTGNRYTLAQLDPENLSDTGLSILKRLNCDLALILLKRRRGRQSDSDKALLDEINNSLKELRDGASVLLGIADVNAPAATLELDAPTAIPTLRPRTIRNQTQNYYPVRRCAQQ